MPLLNPAQMQFLMYDFWDSNPGPDIRPTFLLSELMYNTSVADVHLISVSYSSMYKVGTLKFRN